MREDFKSLYTAISNPRKFIQDKWYPMPASGLNKEFLDWYRHTGNLEFSNGETHFQVVSYPVSEIRNLVGSPKGGKFSEGRKQEVSIDPRAFASESKEIPGVCLRPDIVARIMKKEQDELFERNKKQISSLNHQKKFEEFLKPVEDDLDGL